jgi:hypothetical protein
VSSTPALITITAAGADSTVERALVVAAELRAAGLAAQILAFDEFASRITCSGFLFCPAPGDLAGFIASTPGSVAALRYLATAAPGMPMTLDARLRDSTMILLCDDSPLIPSLAEARALPIFRIADPAELRRGRSLGVSGWFESIRVWHAIRGAVNDMRMFLGLPDFSSPRSFRRSMARIPNFSLEVFVPPLSQNAAVAQALAVAQPRYRQSA